MRALLCTEYGTPAKLELSEIEERPLKPGEIRVEVDAVGLGLVDVIFLGGKYQVKPPLPLIPGREFSGHVVETGPDVDPALTGRLIASIAFEGAFAERTVARAELCLKLSENIDPTVAACLPSAYMTALYALEDNGKLQQGERVLILGAAGTVGLACIEICNMFGGRAIAMASTPEKREFCLAHGAEIAIDGSNPEWRKELEDAVGKVDVVVDLVGGSMSETAFRCLAPGGRHLVVGFASGEIPKLPLNLCLLKRSSVVGVDISGFMLAGGPPRDDLIARMEKLIESGTLTPKPTRVLPLSEAVAALSDQGSRQTQGKTVIRADDWASMKG